MVLDRLISNGVGLASEALQHNKNKKAEKKQLAAEASALSTSINGSSQDISQLPVEATLWEIDDVATEDAQADHGARSPAQRPRAEIPKGMAKEPASISLLVKAFTDAYKPFTHKSSEQLPYAVILPQRRPTSRTRGFIRAYAPCLQNYGITEDMFMDFHNFYYEAKQFSNAIKVVKVAAGVAGTVPSPIVMLTTNAVAGVAEATGSMQSRQRTNDFLSTMNREFFMPIGLVAVVMKYDFADGWEGEKPDVENLMENATEETKWYSFSSKHGTLGEALMPCAAPLVFPDLPSKVQTGNVSSDGSGDEQPKKLSRMKRTSNFVQDYMDRRAQAEFAHKAPDSQLSSAMANQTYFESAWGDPRKVAKYAPPRPRDILAGRGPILTKLKKLRAKDSGNENPVQGGGGDLRGGGSAMPIKGMMSKTVLYMMILPLPTQEQTDYVQNDPSISYTTEEMRV